ncbi:MAG TPA: NAD(P)-dependent oxidoreductase [Candidatus Polarisedimenticolia bacterium]|nr:NAD(P)-dependent oxidoreductase [Candidatus Polarisedimenticolia bacterium]
MSGAGSSGASSPGPGAAARAVAVTGATGFIGRHLCDRFRSAGWDVRALVRDVTAYPFREPGIRTYLCNLPDRLDEEALRSAQVVIHAAYVTRHRSLGEAARVNDAGTSRVLEAARRAGVSRFVFISSQSAHDGALSYYGRSKRALEARLSPDRDLAIRPGLVVGPGQAGLFQRMVETVGRSAIIPLFGGGRQPLQTVHVEDLARAIEAAVEKGLTGVFTIAEPEPTSMRRFLALLAGRLGRRPLFVPVPLAPALAILRLAEAMRLSLPVSSENLLGLRQLRADDTRADLAAIGVPVRSLVASLTALFPGAREDTR